MRFSVVMPSYLGNYGGAAARRDEKLMRAINSVITQTFENWELQIIADGCQETVDIVLQYDDPRVHVTLIPKAPMWDGKPRNTGIDFAKGEFITYLDIDDCYGENHLQIINDNLKDFDWVYYNDYIYDTHSDDWMQRACNIKKLGQNGTSNVTYRRSLGLSWGHRGYAHDHYFNQKLLLHHNYSRIVTPEYFVCHMPGRFDI